MFSDVVCTCVAHSPFTVADLRVHFVLDSSCLLVAIVSFLAQRELMSAFDQPGSSLLSALSIAALEDLGSSVDYSKADFYDATYMDFRCVCNRRRLGHSHAQSTTPKRRKLNKEGEQAAVAYGAAHIAQVQTQTKDVGPDLELDSTVFVLYAEEDEIHGVRVVPDGNGGYHAR